MAESPNDDELLRAAVLGSRDAMEELLVRYGSRIRDKIRGKIDRRWQSVLTEEDVVQETFVEAFLEIRRFEPRGVRSFVSWLITMAQRNAIDAIRELKAAKKGGNVNRVPIDAQASSESYINLFEKLGGTTTSPSRAAYASEVRRALDAALQQLPENYRMAICLYDLAGCTAEDVAAACDCSEGAMHMRRRRAHALLQGLMQDFSSIQLRF